MRDRVEINRTAASMIKQKVRLGQQWFSVAQVLVRNGEVGLAIAAAERGMEDDAGSTKSRFLFAQILSLLGRPIEAMAQIPAISSNELDPAERNNFLGTCALEIGDFALARGAFDRVVEARKDNGIAWQCLSALPPEDDEALLGRIDEAALAIAASSTDSRGRWHYARGAVLDRLGRTDEAFREFSQGAWLIRSTRSYDQQSDRREAHLLRAEYNASAIGRIAKSIRTSTRRPIIVTGLPRSGTTLVEQILASHSQVAGGGELPFGSILTREIGGRHRADLESFCNAESADSLARLYLHLGDERYGLGSRFVDKCLGTSRDLGVLASVLPETPIVWMRRDPLDCAWSCFHTFFSQGIEWSWSLADIAAHFAAEDHLFEHWQQVLGDRLLAISYEELVSNPADHIDLILKHVGLEREEPMDEIHRTARAVTTASAVQVRQPVYRSAIGSARRYWKQLMPFIEAYGRSSSIT
jgi:tetratricopeptide (TPR) repeat protein